MSLITLRLGVAFRHDAAASFARIERHLGREADVNRTTVAYATQLDLYRLYQAGKYPHLVLHPDKSQHVYKPTTDTGGVAWDTDERGDFLDEHGWVIVNRAEPWHREYQKLRDQHIREGWPTSTTTTPTDDEEEDDEMKIITTSAAAVKYEYLRGNRKRSIGTTEWGMLRRLEKHGLTLAIETVTPAELAAIPGK